MGHRLKNTLQLKGYGSTSVFRFPVYAAIIVPGLSLAIAIQSPISFSEGSSWNHFAFLLEECEQGSMVFFHMGTHKVLTNAIIIFKTNGTFQQWQTVFRPVHRAQPKRLDGRQSQATIRL